ncbi:hypothetical protein [Streptomyces collinus]|uniref:hypothetical protein n=1 Tax=Streptomyces collinus TaxID=42684 RepID=UPI0036EFA71F
MSRRSCAAAARQTRAAGALSGSPAGRGHSSGTASRAAAEASPAPASRSGSCDSGAGVVTGSTKASSSAVDAPASTELTTPENSTTKATTTVAATATAPCRAARVPRQMSTAQATARPAWARSRCTTGPVNSTSSSIEKDPNAAYVAIAGEWNT